MNEEALFAAALEKPSAAERQAFLDSACGGDLGLRDRVRDLLATDEHARGILDHGAAAVLDLCRPDRPLAAKELFADRFRLVRKLSEGGMGEVWVADQAEPVRRRVALKVIRPGLDSASLLVRFEAERQALAMMDHPNIAKVLDAGATDGGRPFFVMELVEGVPITQFCDERRLTAKERLELFVPVCQAVQHAHQKGVIHRDLKPSNILVALYDGKPVPKVIDFGVAKASGPRLTDDTLSTEVGALIGTLEYMSPEQADPNNRDIDTRADVYALGVVLYELLTGGVPFSRRQLHAAPFVEMLRIIREVDPPKPSTRLSEARTLDGGTTAGATHPRPARRVPRLFELDWIVMKCLEKDRSRRYESPSALAADIERYLADEPVLAGPPSTGYRLRKFARKYRTVLATAAAFGALLVAGTITSTALASWAVRQKQLADANFKRAHEAVDKMLTRVGAVQLSHVPQMELVRRDLLLDALRFYQEFLRERGDSPVVRAEAARAYQRVGMIQDSLGKWDESETAYRQAAALLNQLLAESPGDPTFFNDVAAIHNGLFKVYLATNRGPQAEAALQRALELLEPIEQGHHGLMDNRYDLAGNYGNLVILHRQTGDLDKAETAFRKSMTLTDGLLAGDPKNADYLMLRARNYANVALVYIAQGRPAEAEAACEKALAINEPLVHDQPNSVLLRRDLSHAYNNLGLAYSRQDKHDQAEAAYKQSLVYKEALLRDYPNVVAFMRGVSSSYANIAMEVRRRSPEEALEWSARAIRTMESALEKEPRNVEARMGLFNTLMGRAYAFRRLKRHEDAAQDWRRAIEVSEGQPHISMRLYRPLVLVFLGEHARATAEVEVVVSERRAQGPDLLMFAEVYSLSSAAAAKDSRLPPADRETLADRYGGRAVELLRMARAAGYFRDSARLTELKENKDLDAISARPDFKDLLGELEKN